MKQSIFFRGTLYYNREINLEKVKDKLIILTLLGRRLGMRDLEDYIHFWPEYSEREAIQDEDLCLIYSEKEVLVEKNDKITFATYKACKHLVKEPSELWYLGKWNGVCCFGYALSQQEEVEGLEWISYKDSKWEDDLELYFIAVKVQHLIGWDKSTRFCGYCGHKNERAVDERAKKCPKCQRVVFPRISPAVIVGIKKDDKLLMAHNANFREGLYSIIAGFVEQGETLEMAVQREVLEEVGIKIKNIRYHHSRPWNSADSLMLGFTAEYESGEIAVDGKEILDAGWYDKDHLPPVLPSKISTARCIIDDLLGLE